MIKKLTFPLLLVAFAVVLFGFVGIQTSSAQTVSNGYSYNSTPVCGYGGCPGYNYSVAMYPYMPVSVSSIAAPAPSWSAITGCGEEGCNSEWGTQSPSYSGYNPMVYYNPRPVYPSYYGW